MGVFVPVKLTWHNWTCLISANVHGLLVRAPLRHALRIKRRNYWWWHYHLAENLRRSHHLEIRLVDSDIGVQLDVAGSGRSFLFVIFLLLFLFGILFLFMVFATLVLVLFGLLQLQGLDFLGYLGMDVRIALGIVKVLWAHHLLWLGQCKLGSLLLLHVVSNSLDLGKLGLGQLTGLLRSLR